MENEILRYRDKKYKGKLKEYRKYALRLEPHPLEKKKIKKKKYQVIVGRAEPKEILLSDVWRKQLKENNVTFEQIKHKDISYGQPMNRVKVYLQNVSIYDGEKQLSINHIQLFKPMNEGMYELTEKQLFKLFRKCLYVNLVDKAQHFGDISKYIEETNQHSYAENLTSKEEEILRLKKKLEKSSRKLKKLKEKHKK